MHLSFSSGFNTNRAHWGSHVVNFGPLGYFVCNTICLAIRFNFCFTVLRWHLRLNLIEIWRTMTISHRNLDWSIYVKLPFLLGRSVVFIFPGLYIEQLLTLTCEPVHNYLVCDMNDAETLFFFVSAEFCIWIHPCIHLVSYKKLTLYSNFLIRYFIQQLRKCEVFVMFELNMLSWGAKSVFVLSMG